MSNDEFINTIIATLASLPPDKQEDAFLDVMTCALNQLSAEDVVSVRADICAVLSQDIPIVRTTVEIIDGNLSLRQLQQEGGAS